VFRDIQVLGVDGQHFAVQTLFMKGVRMLRKLMGAVVVSLFAANIAVADGNKLMALTIVCGDTAHTSVVKLSEDLDRKNLPKNGDGKKEFAAYSYRLATDKSVERFAMIGKAVKISDTQMIVVMPEGQKADFDDEIQSLASNDPMKRRALIVLPQSNDSAKGKVVGLGYAEFEAKVGDGVLKNGAILVPVELGRAAAATSCTCKAFFGCTTGCCTNPTCNVVAGWCQDNSECKKVDLLSDCACRKN
jgi:hypothetical protein